MKTSNLANKQEEVVRPQKGIAQAYGFINRKMYRHSKYGKRRSRNTSKCEIPEFNMGSLRYVPFYKAQRKKLKGWMKNQMFN